MATPPVDGATVQTFELSQDEDAPTGSAVQTPSAVQGADSATSSSSTPSALRALERQAGANPTKPGDFLDTPVRPAASDDGPQETPIPLAAPRGVRGIFRGQDAYADFQPMDMDRISPAHVLLNVYDVGEEEMVQKINYWGTMNDKLLIGGVFHVGVQVYGHEYGYGMVEEPGPTGVCDCPPRCNWQHVYKCTVDCGTTELSESEVSELLQRYMKDPAWEGFAYDLLHHNCLHFANHFCGQVGVRGMPGWLDRFGRIAVKVQSMSEQAQDNWSRGKNVTAKTVEDFKNLRAQVRKSAPELGASISNWWAELHGGGREGRARAESQQMQSSLSMTPDFANAMSEKSGYANGASPPLPAASSSTGVQQQPVVPKSPLLKDDADPFLLADTPSAASSSANTEPKPQPAKEPKLEPKPAEPTPEPTQVNSDSITKVNSSDSHSQRW